MKTVADLFAPISGKVTEINEDLEDSPESVNSDPYGEGWIVKVSIDNAGELDELMTPEQYGDLIC